MRRAWASQTVIAIFLAFVGTPFFHLHVAERHAHDGQPMHGHGSVIHAHLTEAFDPVSGDHHNAGLSHASHEGQPVAFVAGVPANSVAGASPFLVPERIELAPTSASLERFVLSFVPRAHDPPPLGPSNPRSPPA